MSKIFENNNLYGMLTRLGSIYELKIEFSPSKVIKNLEKFSNDWKPYNPKKPIERYGLSITSLHGDLSGVPDLDSLLEYNKENNDNVKEDDINVKTPVYEVFQDVLDEINLDLIRSHVIKLSPGGYFPIHRDNPTAEINSFRLFLPLRNCNPPSHYFILDDKILSFNLGSTYFIDTCIPHTLFNVSFKDTIFAVFNIKLSLESIEKIYKFVKIM